MPSPVRATSLVVLIGALALAGCASHPDVRPGTDGLHRVMVHGADRQTAQRGALDQARSYCEAQHRDLAVIEEKTRYVGSMDEREYRRIRDLSRAGSALGGGLLVFGGESERKAGAAMLGASQFGDALTSDEAYMTEMSFRCP